MQLCELKYRASMSIDPIWEKRYRSALQYDLRDPVNLDEVDRILNCGVVETPVVAEAVVEIKQETWRDRSPLF